MQVNTKTGLLIKRSFNAQINNLLFLTYKALMRFFIETQTGKQLLLEI